MNGSRAKYGKGGKHGRGENKSFLPFGPIEGRNAKEEKMSGKAARFDCAQHNPDSAQSIAKRINCIFGGFGFMWCGFFFASLTPKLKLSDFKTLALGFEGCTVHEREGTKLIMLIFFCKSTCIYHPKSNSIHFVCVCGVFVANEKRQPGNDHQEEHFECLKYGKRKPS